MFTLNLLVKWYRWTGIQNVSKWFFWFQWIKNLNLETLHTSKWTWKEPLRGTLKLFTTLVLLLSVTMPFSVSPTYRHTYTYKLLTAQTLTNKSDTLNNIKFLLETREIKKNNLSFRFTQLLVTCIINTNYQPFQQSCQNYKTLQSSRISTKIFQNHRAKF